MIKRISAILLATLMLCALAIPSFAASQTATEITGEYVIYIKESCCAGDSAAATVLADYLEKILGSRPEITSAKAESGKRIIVGEAAEQDLSSLIDNSYKISEKDGDILISGNGKRGTVTGAYAFLEKICSVNAYTSSLIEVPVSSLISVPKGTEITYSPYFEYTETDWASPTDEEYSLFNGLTGGVYRTIDESKGGTVNYISGFAHTLTNQFCKSSEYFSAHPEYFALHSGERTPDQLCLTNEDVYNIVLGEVMQLLEEKHDPEADLQIVSLTQHDNQKYCQCDACKALDDENSSHQGSLLTFVNRIAAAVAAAGYNNVAIDTFAYQYTRSCPTKVVPEKNVIIRLCTIECCFSHTLDDSTCEENTALMKDLSDWSKICNRIYIWDYTTNYSQTLGIFPDFGVIGRNLQIFAENGVKGVYEEGNYYMAACNTEFGELRSYLLSKCLQNPYCDVDALTDAFLKAYYGAGAEDIGEFIDTITENAATHHLGIYMSMSESLTLSKEDIARCDELWENALAKTENSEQYANVKRSNISWRYWKACCNKSEFSRLSLSQFSAKKQLKNDLEQIGITKYNEGQKLNITAFYMFYNPDSWNINDSDTKNVYDVTGTIISVAGYVVCLLAALIMLIKGIKQKKYFYISPFIVYLVMLEIVMWHRRAYLSWNDMAGYAVTLVLLILTFAFMFIVFAHAGKKENTAKRFALSGLTGALVFAVPFELLLYGINVVIYREQGNAVTISVALAYAGTLAAVMSILTLVRLIGNSKKAVSSEKSNEETHSAV